MLIASARLANIIKKWVKHAGYLVRCHLGLSGGAKCGWNGVRSRRQRKKKPFKMRTRCDKRPCFGRDLCNCFSPKCRNTSVHLPVILRAKSGAIAQPKGSVSGLMHGTFRAVFREEVKVLRNPDNPSSCACVACEARTWRATDENHDDLKRPGRLATSRQVADFCLYLYGEFSVNSRKNDPSRSQWRIFLPQSLKRTRVQRRLYKSTKNWLISSITSPTTFLRLALISLISM